MEIQKGIQVSNKVGNQKYYLMTYQKPGGISASQNSEAPRDEAKPYREKEVIGNSFSVIVSPSPSLSPRDSWTSFSVCKWRYENLATEKLWD